MLAPCMTVMGVVTRGVCVNEHRIWTGFSAMYCSVECLEQHVWLHAQDGTGPGNTALAFHNKQLLALVETDLPYIVSFFVCFPILKPG